MFGKYFQLWLLPFDYPLDLVITLAEFCQNFEEETSRLEPNLDPVNSPVNDEVPWMFSDWSLVLQLSWTISQG